MKKLLLLLGVLTFIFASCKKEYIPVQDTTPQTILFNVPSDSWSSNDGGVTYYNSLDVPEITSDFNQNGEVSVYISFGNGTFEQIPEVYNDMSLSFTHNVGDVTVYAQDLTHAGMPAPSNATIKIVLTEAAP